MQVREIMTPYVISVSPDATVAQAIQIMLDRHISGLLVVDGASRLVGIMTEGDLLRRSELGTAPRRPRWLQFLLSPGRLAEEYEAANGRLVKDVMTRDVVTVEETTRVEDVLELMQAHGIKRVPVMLGQHPIGVVSRADFLRALGTALRDHPTPPNRDDAAILRDIQALFESTTWVPKALVEPSVENGKVTLRGSILDERERGALRVAVETVPGVRAVEDRLTWVEPMSGLVLLSPEEMGAEKSETQI